MLTATAVAACGSSGSLQSDRNFNKRVYVGGGLLASNLEPDTSNAAGVSVDESASGGGSVFLGYDLSNRFTLEGHYADLGEASFSPNGSIGYQVGGLSALVYGLNSEENRLTRTGFSAFGRLGVGALANDAEGVEFNKVNDVHLLAGIGVEYGLENGLAGRAELIAHDSDAQYGQLALLYRFGAGSDNSNARAPAVRERNLEDASSQESVVEAAPSSEAAVVLPVLPPAEPESSALASAAADDNDGDGVSDGIDACPDSATATPVDETGCAVFGGAIEGVNFTAGSDQLTDGATVVLSEVVDTLNEYPDVKIMIMAHTDNTGDAGENLQLSKRRALSVARYLVEQGISGSRLRAQAFGESEPRTSNETPEGRTANRRVEFQTFE